MISKEFEEAITNIKNLSPSYKRKEQPCNGWYFMPGFHMRIYDDNIVKVGLRYRHPRLYNKQTQTTKELSEAEFIHYQLVDIDCLIRSKTYQQTSSGSIL